SIRNCIYAASFISIPAGINHWNLIPLYGRLNYSLLTYIPAQLKDLKKLKDHAKYSGRGDFQKCCSILENP
uniref:Uncharacterized protein n=1 Tax=Romanomermis culicivorax TaxID=13658 RepID=A0A915JKD5_ROMCU